jgi:hypothetical protein
MRGQRQQRRGIINTTTDIQMRRRKRSKNSPKLTRGRDAEQSESEVRTHSSAHHSTTSHSHHSSSSLRRHSTTRVPSPSTSEVSAHTHASSHVGHLRQHGGVHAHWQSHGHVGHPHTRHHARNRGRVVYDTTGQSTAMGHARVSMTATIDETAAVGEPTCWATVSWGRI